MSSNIGSQFIQDIEDRNELKKRIDENLKKNFRPEFLNRIDEIVIFDKLGKSEIEKIVKLELKYLKQRLSKKKISLEITDKAKKQIAELGYDSTYGARLLRRVIQKKLQDKIALDLLDGKIKEKNKIVVDCDKRDFLIKKR